MGVWGWMHIYVCMYTEARGWYCVSSLITTDLINILRLSFFLNSELGITVSLAGQNFQGFSVSVCCIVGLQVGYNGRSAFTWGLGIPTVVFTLFINMCITHWTVSSATSLPLFNPHVGFQAFSPFLIKFLSVNFLEFNFSIYELSMIAGKQTQIFVQTI